MARLVKATPLVLTLVLLVSISAGISAPTATAHADSVDRTVLIALYNATDGANWTNNDNWMTDAPIGEWHGIEVDGGGRVIRLSLFENDLNGPIPSQLGNLAALTHLRLWSNQLTGEIPPELANLANLEQFAAGGNRLSGNIPEELGSLSSLKYLNLNNNRLTGEIPMELGNLSSLEDLYLQGNQFTGCIPLELRHVSDNDLDQLGLLFCGPDPDVPYLTWEVGYEVPAAREQNLREGVLLMHRYAESFGLPELQDLDLATVYVYHNPDALAEAYARVMAISLDDARRRLAAVTWLAEADFDLIFVFSNRLSEGGHPPVTAISNAAHELSHVYQFRLGDVENPDPEGRILSRGPTWLIEGVAEFHAIRSLAKGGVISYEQRRKDFVHTALGVASPLSGLETRAGVIANPGAYEYGAMAAELLAAEAGEEAMIAYWTLLGPETPWQEAFQTAFGMTVDGFYVLFEDHRAAGFPALGLPSLEPDIPVSPVDRAALAALYNATGGANWANNESWLSDASGNEWHGVTVNRDGRVTRLDLRNNRLTGEIPSELGNLADLEQLSLPDNQLSGEIPSQLGNLAALTHLRLWSNQLTGEIPPELADLANLEQFAAGGNRLSGNIPEELGNLSNLRELHLPTNQLTGEIPSELGSLSSLKYLNLNNNRLTGEIPAELENLTNLEDLYLSRNQLTGCLPAVWRDVPNNDLDQLGLDFCQVEVPDAPLGLTAEVSENEAEVDLSWTAPTFTGGAPITGYLIESSVDGNSPWTEVITTTGDGTTYTDDGTDANGLTFGVGATQYYRVSAINSVGTGAPSNVAITDDLVARYDVNNNGTIERGEVIKAIRDYLDGGGGISRSDVIRLIRLYLDG